MLSHCINFTNICHIWWKPNVNISSVLKSVYLFNVFPLCKKFEIQCKDYSMCGLLCIHRNLFQQQTNKFVLQKSKGKSLNCELYGQQKPVNFMLFGRCQASARM
ncbi:hypothetical protein VNO80_07798 [Phaseolus coccineus]|uniref:Uncharacterized protein n=1 Tax=Phaseolus coccineus TaxID=3886 RepID=A0AAN9NPC7_PHACN